MSLSANRLRRFFTHGMEAHKAGDLRRALEWYVRIISIAPSPAAINTLGQEDEEKAMAVLAAFHQAAIAARQLWSVGRATGRRTEAQLKDIEDQTRRFMSISVMFAPQNAAGVHNMAKFCVEHGDLQDALQLYRNAVAVNPVQGESWTNLGNLLGDLGDRAGAEAAWNRAAAIPASGPDGRFNLSFMYLLRGDYAKGWALYESRWDSPEFRHGYRRPDIQKPRWRGDPLRGRTLLVHSEQGNGDAIQFGRYVALLAGENVVVEVLDGLESVFRAAFPDRLILARGEPLPKYDLHIPMMSMPLAFKTTLEAVPAPLPIATQRIQLSDAVAALAIELEQTPGLRVGIAWAGSTQHTKDRFRSMPDEVLEELAGTAGVTFVNLQVGERARGFDRLNGIDATPALKSFGDTAALLQHLDVVLSIDSAVAHLAGSCVPERTWILLPFSAEWRWLQDREDSPWYPGAKLMRQKIGGDWRELLRRVRADLESHQLQRAA
jgi:hypothetical protein